MNFMGLISSEVKHVSSCWCHIVLFRDWLEYVWIKAARIWVLGPVSDGFLPSALCLSDLFFLMFLCFGRTSSSFVGFVDLSCRFEVVWLFAGFVLPWRSVLIFILRSTEALQWKLLAFSSFPFRTLGSTSRFSDDLKS